MPGNIRLRVLASTIFLTLIIGACSSSAPLAVQISEDGKNFSWTLDGQQVDPVKQGVVWKVNFTRWNDARQPTHGQGKATIKDAQNSYDATADFTLDEKGYKQIKLTLSGGTLSKEMSATADRK